MGHITTYTKLHIDPLNPSIDDICLYHIAHSLSLLTRATGHFPQFYSVAHHCLNCAKEAEARGYDKRVILACLLHDGAESYLNDVTRSVKSLIPLYEEIEKRFLNLIYTKFLGSHITEEEEQLVKEIDDTILFYEFRHYMDEDIKEEEPLLLSKPVFRYQIFEDVEDEYKEKAKELIFSIMK